MLALCVTAESLALIGLESCLVVAWELSKVATRALACTSKGFRRRRALSYVLLESRIPQKKTVCERSKSRVDRSEKAREKFKKLSYIVVCC
jgi:hypothetical protein